MIDPVSRANSPIPPEEGEAFHSFKAAAAVPVKISSFPKGGAGNKTDLAVGLNALKRAAESGEEEGPRKK